MTLDNTVACGSDTVGVFNWKDFRENRHEHQQESIEYIVMNILFEFETVSKFKCQHHHKMYTQTQYLEMKNSKKRAETIIIQLQKTLN